MIFEGVDVRGRLVWGGMESDGMYDMCYVGSDVPMWVGLMGAMLFKSGMLRVFFLCVRDLGT